MPIAWHFKKMSDNTTTIEMVPIVSSNKLDMNMRIQKVLEEKGINPCAYEQSSKGSMAIPHSTSSNGHIYCCAPLKKG